MTQALRYLICAGIETEHGEIQLAQFNIRHNNLSRSHFSGAHHCLVLMFSVSYNVVDATSLARRLNRIPLGGYGGVQSHQTDTPFSRRNSPLTRPPPFGL